MEAGNNKADDLINYLQTVTDKEQAYHYLCLLKFEVESMNTDQFKSLLPLFRNNLWEVCEFTDDNASDLEELVLSRLRDSAKLNKGRGSLYEECLGMYVDDWSDNIDDLKLAARINLEYWTYEHERDVRRFGDEDYEERAYEHVDKSVKE